MRNITHSVVAATIILAGAMLGHCAQAMTPAALGAATAAATLMQRAAVVCGNAGCAPVQVKRLQKHQMPKPLPPAHPAS
jgi:NAD(P)H-hydrate repair Nnr-like enzyme with NAD(P)H-hydrate dehydratase domain